MGSPVSFTVVNLVMEDSKERALETYHTEIMMQKRYVDDIFVVIQDLLEKFHSHLNSVEKTIQFTKELENEGRSSFLDVVVSRKEDGASTTKVYRKPTHTGHYLNFPSYCPMEHKEAVGKAPFRRAGSQLAD